MKELVNWLRNIEHLANEVYLQAGERFKDDAEFKEFLERNGEDEAWHYHVMGSAAEFLSSKPDVIPAILVDKETHDKIVNYFVEIRRGLENKTLTKRELIKKIVAVELSEWNDIFLYVVNYLKEQADEFIYPVARMQTHIKEVEAFLEKIEGDPALLKKIKEMPPVWTENILIVDDEEIIAHLVKSLLNREGNIDIATNGQEALNMINKTFYKLIICDVDMPVMDGLTLYEQTVTKFPSLNKRFLFITGYITEEKQAFFDRYKLKAMTKPVEIQELNKVASEMILSN